jgi:tetrahydromethanopterin S-methyltransferase subunit B
MKFPNSPLRAALAILFFVASIMAFAYGVRVGAGLVGLLAVVLIALSIYAQARK